MKSIGIIPARYASSRFPGKPLIQIAGKSMIQRVYEQCLKSKLLDDVIVATDDPRILQHVQDFGGKVTMTDARHRSGTARCAEVAKQHSAANIIVNIQGDEPFINPLQIDELIQISGNGIATQAKKITNTDALFSSNVVKVVLGKTHQALYFSRSPIPFFRSIPKQEWLQNHAYYKHIGLYSFDRDTLLSLEELPQGKLEKIESLEQLNWLENGIRIQVGITAFESIGIDSPEDIEKAITHYKLDKN